MRACVHWQVRAFMYACVRACVLVCACVRVRACVHASEGVCFVCASMCGCVHARSRVGVGVSFGVSTVLVW